MEQVPGPDPLAVLVGWLAEARRAGALEPDAMTLATATPDGLPSARGVLFKGLEQGELWFVTDYASRKGRELELNPDVALVFFWPELMRQVRLEGRATRPPATESDAYFRTRPRESQLAAWASEQSQPLVSRAVLEQRFADVEARFRGRDVERPPSWGVYRVTPRMVELFIARPGRLNDRFRYTRAGTGWTVERLCP
jgi:pyridoxamine 5'-phosphate oxidase